MKLNLEVFLSDLQYCFSTHPQCIGHFRTVERFIFVHWTPLPSTKPLGWMSILLVRLHIKPLLEALTQKMFVETTVDIITIL